MLRKLLESLAVWLVVSVVLWLIAVALLTVHSSLPQAVGNFFDQTNVVIGFVAAVWYFFFGSRLTPRP